MVYGHCTLPDRGLQVVIERNLNPTRYGYPNDPNEYESFKPINLNPLVAMIGNDTKYRRLFNNY